MLKTFMREERKFIEGLKNEIFPLYYNEAYEYQMKAQRQIGEEEMKEKRRRRREKKEKQKRRDRKPFNLEEIIKWLIDRRRIRKQRNISKIFSRSKA